MAQVEKERKDHEVLEKQAMEERARMEAEEEVAALAEILELELEEMMGVGVALVLTTEYSVIPECIQPCSSLVHTQCITDWLHPSEKGCNYLYLCFHRNSVKRRRRSLRISRRLL